MSRMLNFVLGVTSLVAGGAAYKYYKELEERDSCSCNQAGSPQPGQSSYAQMRLFYKPPMVRAWSPSYSGAMTDPALYAEAQRVYQKQIQDAEPKDAWDRDGEIGLPPAPPRETVPVPGQMPNVLPHGGEAQVPAGSIRLPQGVEAMPLPSPAGMPQGAEARPLPESRAHRAGTVYDATEAAQPMWEQGFGNRRGYGTEADLSEMERAMDFERRKREFESRYQGTYEEFLRLQEEARRAGRIIKPVPRRRSMTESRTVPRTITV